MASVIGRVRAAQILRLVQIEQPIDSWHLKSRFSVGVSVDSEDVVDLLECEKVPYASSMKHFLTHSTNDFADARCIVLGDKHLLKKVPPSLRSPDFVLQTSHAQIHHLQSF